jgi:hypothetical protein
LKTNIGRNQILHPLPKDDDIFSRTCRRAAYHYIKKKKRRARPPVHQVLPVLTGRKKLEKTPQHTH